MKGGMSWCWALLGVSPQGHLKFISRSLESQTDKTWFCRFYLFPTHLEWRWILQMTDVDTLLVGYQSTTHRKGFVCHFSLGGGGGDYPLGIPLITPLYQRCSESTKLLRFSSVEHQLQPSWQHMDTELGMKDDMGWCCALLGYHPKVTSRSSQGNCKVKLCLYLFQTHLGCSAGDYYKWLLLTHFCSDTISPRIANRNYAISLLGGGGGVITALNSSSNM